MVISFMRLLEKLTGLLLGGLAISVQIGNILICIIAICFGPALVTGRLPL